MKALKAFLGYSLATTFVSLAFAQDDTCEAEQHWIVEYPLLVSQHVPSNTILTLPNGDTLPITNAPTALSTLLTGTSISTGTTIINIGGIEININNTGGAGGTVTDTTLTTDTATATAGGGGVVTSPTSTPIPGTFQLYISSPLLGLNALAVGENGAGEIVVGGVDTATTLAINAATSLVDLVGNLIFFTPTATAAVKLKNRRQITNQTVLQYGPTAPSGSVSTGYSLNGITLNITDGTNSYTPYLCTQSPSQQPIFVGLTGQIPPNCFTFTLVTSPGPLASGTSSGSGASSTSGSGFSTSSGHLIPYPLPSTTSTSSSTSADESGELSGHPVSPTYSVSSQSPGSPSPAPPVSTSVDLLAQATAVILEASLQPFCSSLLGYTTPTVTATSVGVSTTSVTSTVTVGTLQVDQTETDTDYFTVPAATSVSVYTPVVTETATSTTVVAYTYTEPPTRRKRAGETPSPLATFPASIVTSACSLEATPVSTTVTSIVAQSTVSSIVATTTVPVTVNVTVATNSQSFTFSIGTSITVSTAPESTYTTTEVSTSSTTITVAYGAPTGTISYLQIDPEVNSGADYALSDPATHMTDNYYAPTDREIFLVTTSGQLYSVTNNAYYYPQDATTGGGKLFWSNTAADGSTEFYTVPTTDGTNRQQLFLTNTNVSPNVPWLFCVATAASGDGNGQTGLHVHYYSDPSQVSDCVETDLYLEPTS